MFPRKNSASLILVGVLSENVLASNQLRGILEADGGAKALDCVEFLALSPRAQSRGILLIDQFGLQSPLSRCMRDFESRAPGVKFLVLDRQLSRDEIIWMLFLGAHGCLEHRQATSQLLPAVRHLATGGLWVEPDVLQMFLTEVGTTLRKGTRGSSRLTERELQVLELVRLRLSNREISESLMIRINTVKFHLSNILSKLHMHTRRELYGDRAHHSLGGFPIAG